MKKKHFSSVSIMALGFSLSLFLILTACGASPASSEVTGQADSGDIGQSTEDAVAADTTDTESIVGIWDEPDLQVSIEFRDDGTGTESNPWESREFTYTWDGATGEFTMTPDDTDFPSVGFMDDSGYLRIPDSSLYRVEEPGFVPGMFDGGNEEGLEGEWIHNGGTIKLSFDGESNMSYYSPDGNGPFDSLAGLCSYNYDGETLTVYQLDYNNQWVTYEGYIDDEGDLILDLGGSGGWYTRGDTPSQTESESETDYIEEFGYAGSDFIGAWDNDELQSSLIFYDDGTVEYYQPDLDSCFIGYVSEWYGKNVVISYYEMEESYHGIIDEDGALVFDHIDGFFEKVDEAFYVF